MRRCLPYLLSTASSLLSNNKLLNKLPSTKNNNGGNEGEALGMMNGSSGNKMTRSSDGCDDDALANISISSPLDDALTALRQKYGLASGV